MDVDKALAIDNAVQSKKEPSTSLVSSIVQSTVGSELFQPEAVKAEFKMFLATIDEKVHDLEYHEYEESEVAAFKACMSKHSEHMTEDYKDYDEGTTTLKFLHANIQYSCTCLNDQWEWRMVARATSIGVSNGQLPRLPWETLLYGKPP